MRTFSGPTAGFFHRATANKPGCRPLRPTSPRGRLQNPSQPDMANPNTPINQSPPSISAAELRRRLLASTPPPIAPSTSTNDAAEELPENESAEAAGDAPPQWNGPGSAHDLLARLKMPGKSGP